MKAWALVLVAGIVLTLGSAATGFVIRMSGNTDNLYPLLAAFMLGLGMLIGVMTSSSDS